MSISPESFEQELISLKTRMQQAEQRLSDMMQRFDTLQTPLWKRIVFRIDGWPGQSDLNAEGPSWRPWRKWWTS